MPDPEGMPRAAPADSITFPLHCIGADFVESISDEPTTKNRLATS